MKKAAMILIVLCLTLSLTACFKKDNIPTLKDIQDNTEEWATEKLTGHTIEELKDTWGDPSGSLSGMYGYIWKLSDDENGYVVIYFDSNNKVESVKKGE